MWFWFGPLATLEIGSCSCNGSTQPDNIRHAGYSGGHPWLSSGDLEGGKEPREAPDEEFNLAEWVVIAIALLSLLAGLVIPLVFGILAILHGNKFGGIILLTLSLSGTLPLVSCNVIGFVGFRSLHFYRSLVEDEIVHNRRYDY